MNNMFAKSYRDPKWHSFRTRIFQRDNFTCCHCGIKREASDLIYDISKAGKLMIILTLI